MSGILGTISHWTKSPAPSSVNGDKEPRGTKRKAKGDPYDVLDDDDATPQKNTPSSLRTRSRISSEAPSSGTKGRPTSAGRTATKRRSRSLGVRKDDGVDGSRVDAAANLARAQEPQAARLHPQPEDEQSRASLAPVADMGIPEASNDTNSPNGPANKTATRTAKGKAKAKATQGDQADKGDEADQEEAQVDDGEELEVHAILQHRMAQDESGRVELLVHWEGETEEEATWEPEEEIQRGAAETLYAYWRTKGGRMNTLFIKPKNPPPQAYHVFKVLRHAKKPRGGFEFEVQWVGHPPTRPETTMEAEYKLRKVAPAALSEYWESIGGRDQFLTQRGRGKRPRTE
ncbi:hypothetical protein F5Y05DRAFT_397692 [Hypoxylon sp. FL0543]|nr:hypothetical protein F5Y05DRAFT_397692 [Hypoxylon sp. FL0543]